MLNYEELSNLLSVEIQRTISSLEKTYGLENVHGFALATDDDVSHLYYCFCTYDWVKQESIAQDYEGIGYIFVEWPETPIENLLGATSQMFFDAANSTYDTEDLWGYHRDLRFMAMSSTLAKLRKDNVFKEATFLCLGSTDPSDHMEKLEWQEIQKYNSKENLEHYLRVMDL